MKSTRKILIVTCIVAAISAAGTVIPLIIRISESKSEEPAQVELFQKEQYKSKTANRPVFPMKDSTAKKIENETNLDSIKRVKHP